MERCDHKSAGVIITNNNQDMLMIERAKAPHGWAVPAGHVDDHGRHTDDVEQAFRQTAKQETLEEVGLVVPLSGLTRVIDQQRVERRCRRGGEYHVWNVYTASQYSGQLKPKLDEVLTAEWVSPAKLQTMAEHTLHYNTGSDPSSTGDRMLEPTWFDFLVQLGYVAVA